MTFLDKLLDPLFYQLSCRLLKFQQTKTRNPYLVTKNYQGLGDYQKINSKQNPYEINTLLSLIKKLKPKTVCEIGTYKGGTLYLWCQTAARDATLFSCDQNPGLDNMFSTSRQKFYQNFARGSQKLIIIAADSHNPQTAVRLKPHLPKNRHLDFLFIDGDHSYTGVKKDFANFLPLVKKGGMIAFHDIVDRPQYPHIQVRKLWLELKKKYKYQEIIDLKNPQQQIGIGIIWV